MIDDLIYANPELAIKLKQIEFDKYMEQFPQLKGTISRPELPSNIIRVDTTCIDSRVKKFDKG